MKVGFSPCTIFFGLFASYSRFFRTLCSFRIGLKVNPTPSPSL
jgi:hypothetical protein